MTDTYNGWTNRETWLVGLWLDNEETSYTVCRMMARQTLEKEGDRAAGVFATYLREEIENSIPPLPGLAGDLMGVALAKVNWYEIAKHYLDDMENG